MSGQRANGHQLKGVANGDARSRMAARQWNVQASPQALNTSNPIREIIETMNLSENPNKKVIPLSIGDPTIFGNLKPCGEILDALQRANSCGKYYGYQTAAGMEGARESVAEYHYRCTGNKVSKQDVILASGCSHAIDLCICVLAKPGQNILIPRPGFPLYKTLTSIYQVNYKQYDLLADQNWLIDLQHLESLIDEHTAAIVVNNPSNPCGSVFPEEHLLAVLELADKYKLPIIADEIYDKFVFSPESYERRDADENVQPTDRCGLAKLGAISPDVFRDQCDGELIDGFVDDLPFEGKVPSYIPFISLSSLSSSVPILTCGGISKTCLIPGLRLGWIIINDRANNFDVSVRNGLSRLTQRLMGPNSLVQGALSDILNTVPESFYAQTMDFIFKNARLCYERLLQIRGLHPYMPQGSMYLMVKFDAKSFPTIDDDLHFTSRLMNEESVLVLPGKCFDFPNYFRICLTVPTNVMEEAAARIRDFCQRHYVADMNIKNNNSTSLKISSLNQHHGGKIRHKSGEPKAKPSPITVSTSHNQQAQPTNS